MEEESKSISLSPQLTPTVSFKLMKNSYLGQPYTGCKQSAVNETVLKDTYYIAQHDKGIENLMNLKPQLYLLSHVGYYLFR